MPHPFERRFKQKSRGSRDAPFNAHGARRFPITSVKIPGGVMPATAVDRQRVLDLMAGAFIADPPSRFLYPELDAYRRNFPRFVDGFAGAAFAQGGAYQIADFAGAALWLKPGAHPDDAALEALFEETLPAAKCAEVGEVIARMANFHPAEPHWHLAMVGVDPRESGKGYGSALIEAGLADVDRGGHTAYLESTNPKNIPLYEKFGFKLVGTIDTGRCPPVFPMVRRQA